jgi:pantoate--beta-alanine ligase
VATVVAKLFNLVEPDLAVFGEKDYQQLVVIRRMVEDLCCPVEIVPATTGREQDGLAMSSRNQYLTDNERAIAPVLFAELRKAVEALGSGKQTPEELCRAGLAALEEAGFRPDYFEIRRASDLAQVGEDDLRVVIMAAAWLGRARLIDNIQVDLEYTSG